MQILRHAQFSITMEIYTQVSSKATREALNAWGRVSMADDCCIPLLYGHKNGHLHRWKVASDLRGRYWDRTSDLFGVNEALSR